MRLRERIRPPQRYSSDKVVQTGPERIPRCARPANKPPFVDYNPNLPPAVFPTLDEAKPLVDPDQLDKSIEGREQHGQRPGNEINEIHAPGDEGDEMSWQPTDPPNTDKPVLDKGDDEDALMHNMRLDNEDNPFNVPDRTAPVAEANPPGFSPPAEPTEDEVFEAEFIHSCEDDPNDYIPIPTWSEISARLQVEIVHNLEKSLTWSEIVYALRLTRPEERSVLQHCQYRNTQLETENRIIRDMHTEQLEAILSVNNLDVKKQRAPDQLVLQRSMRRSMDELMPRVSPDYLMCEPWELVSSRRYLRHVGLNPKLAGEWTGNIVTLRNKNGTDEEPIPLRATTDDTDDEQEGEAGQYGVDENEIITDRAERDPKFGFLNGVGMKDGADPVDGDDEQPSKPPPPSQLNAAQQIFRVRYAKSTSRERSRSRSRARAYIQGPEQAKNIVQLNVGRHRAAEIRSSPPSSEHVAPAEGNEGRQLPTPPQRVHDNSADNTLEADRQKRAASVPQARVQPPFPDNNSARGSSVGVANNAATLLENVNQGEIKRPLHRNLGGSWSCKKFGSDPNSTPCPPTRFRDGIEESTSQSSPPDADTRKSQQSSSFALPIRTSPLAAASRRSSSQSRASRDREGDGSDHAISKKKRKVRVSLEGSPILPGSSTDRSTPEISDPPGFEANQEQRLASSPTRPRLSANNPRSVDCEYPSPPTVRKNPRCLFDSQNFGPKTPEMPTSRCSLLQTLSQSRTNQPPDSNMVEQAGVNVATSQCNQKLEAGAPAFDSNLDPRLFGPPGQATAQETNAPSGKPSLSPEAPQANQCPPSYTDQQVTEARELVGQAEESVGDGGQDPTPENTAEVMDIDTEEASQLEATTLSESTGSGIGDTTLEEGNTTLSDSQASGFADTTLEEGSTTLSDSRMSACEDTILEDNPAPDVVISTGTLKLSKEQKPKKKVGTKTRKTKAAGHPKTAAKGTTKPSTKAAAAKKIEKPKGERTQPRRVSKNGPELKRELRPRPAKKT